MNTMTQRASFVASFMAVTIATALAQGRSAPERFSALAMVGADHQSSRPVEIVINESSTDVEASALVAVFDLKGGDGLFGALHTSRTLGQLRAPDGHVHQLRYVRETRLPSGARHLLLLVDPPLGIAELLSSRPSGRSGQNATFAAVAVWLSADGEGEGQLAGGDKIMKDLETSALGLDYGGPHILLPSVVRTPSVR
jgi:hypothetical protein